MNVVTIPDENFQWKKPVVAKWAHPQFVGRYIKNVGALRWWIMEKRVDKDGKEEEVEIMYRFKGFFVAERFGHTAKHRFAMKGYAINEGHPVGPEVKCTLDLPTMPDAGTKWRLVHFVCEKSGGAIIRAVFPHMNNGVTKLQISMSHDTEEEAQRALVVWTWM
jgi:hypothetical protein